MSPLQARMAMLKTERERAQRHQEDLILADAELPDADLLVREVAQQIRDRRNSPK